jgi:hypothetical protein
MKTVLYCRVSLSIGLAVASGSPLLRWQAPRKRRVLYVDGEMPLVSLQERLRAISKGLDDVIPNEGFRVLAADNTKNGLSIGSEEGQRGIDPLLSDVDLVIFDNLSTLCTNGSESASDAWVPMQNWLLKLRRQSAPRWAECFQGASGWRDTGNGEWVLSCSP